ncbi:MAG: sigma-54-dependent Fis family transcriptional regulator [Bacteroidales bacterium]|nr:sigma-54-dependent Fis family transcriptional regulator [Bacteroidales bacterium]
MKLKILVVDDEQRVRDEIGEFLTENRYKVYMAGLPSEAYKILEEEDIDIVILDIRLPEEDGLKVLGKIKKQYPETEVIMISGHGDMNSVIEALRSGASDFFPKPFRLMDVHLAIQRTSRFINLNSRIRDLEKNFQMVSDELHRHVGHQLIAVSPAMKKVLELMGKISKVDQTTVLITGESGTGKELVARGIHYLSNRRGEFFHTVNCSAIPETLFESEFFGHRKGSFTGAVENKAGWFEIANKGTLFLDEIGDMPLSQQAKLLRVLEEKSVSRIGSHDKVEVDVRVIAASNQNLEQMSTEKEFRLDLYHRISSFVIHIPPLRERPEEIPALLEYFIRYYSKRLGKTIKGYDSLITRELSSYHFPGNIRELRNMVERAIILCDDPQLSLKDFGHLRLAAAEPVAVSSCDEDIMDLEVSEKQLIMKALQKAGFNKSRAAEMLNISWQSLDRRMKKFGL